MTPSPKFVKMSKGIFDKLCDVQAKMQAKLPTRPTLGDVIEQLCNAYLEGQK